MMQNFRILFFTLLIIAITNPACKEREDDDGNGQITCTGDFDLESMYLNIADNIIIPSYRDLQESIRALEESHYVFADEPTVSKLQTVRENFKQAYLDWQTVAQYDFGPAETFFLKNVINNFPLNVEETRIFSTLEAGTAYVSDPNSFSSGLPAMDYFLYGVAETDDEIVTFYASSGDGVDMLNYIGALIQDMRVKAQSTLNEWTNNYKQEFISNTGTAAGSSLSLLLNGFNKQYEIIKREKLGIPSGVLTLEIPNPEKAEGFYSDLSFPLTIKALQASLDLYKGKQNNGSDNVGFEELLKFINAQKDNSNLDDIIQQQFSTAISTLQELESQGTMTELIELDQPSVVMAYNEVTKQLVNIKTDMPSILCVSITYIDNPSDSD